MKQDSDEPINHPCFVLQQRRLKHVTSVCVRNLTISLPSDQEDDVKKEPFLYLTLHSNNREVTAQDSDVIFTSDKNRYSPNLTWSNIKVVQSGHSYLTNFTVRLWIGNGDGYMPALQWEVELETLNCIGPSLHSDKVIFHSNAVVFGLHGLYYAHNTSVTTSHELSLLPWFDISDIRASYNVFSLRRIISCKTAAVQCRRNVTSIHKEIRERCLLKKKFLTLESELENIQHKISRLQNLLERERMLLSKEKEVSNKEKWKIQQREADLESRKEQLTDERLKHRENYNTYVSSHENTARIVTQLGLRRRDVLSQLSHIFPIATVQETARPHKKATPTSGEIFTICGIKLPDSEHFNHKEDSQTSVALGYTSQLLSMMSQFLLVPLRYPIIHNGSQSSIIDHVTEKLSDRERMFPIHVKGNKDRFLFEYGVFLLNKNVAQLRYYCGLGTSDLRPTLHNVKSLLEERLGAKSMIGHHSQPIAINETRQPRMSSVESNSSIVDKKLLEESSVPVVYASQGLVDSPHKLNKIGQSDVNTSPHKFVQRMESRNTGLSNLRDELFGSTEVKRSRDRSPMERKDNKEALKPLEPPANTSYRVDMNQDSIDSVSPNLAPRRTHLSGLEDISQSDHAKKDPKVSLATARAELLGKKSGQRSQDSSRWGRRTGSAMSEIQSQKRSELFLRNQQRKDHSDSNSSSETGSIRNKTDSSASSDSKQETGSNQSKAASQVEDFTFIDDEEIESVASDDKPRPPKVIDKKKDPMPYMSAISSPKTSSNSKRKGRDVFLSNKRDVFILDPDAHMMSINTSEEEIDLC